MSRIFEIRGYGNYCADSDLANLFDVDVVECRDGSRYKAYNLGRTVVFDGAGKQEQPLTYLVAQGDTWQLISYNLYGDVRYWWILAKLNGCTDATVDPEPGSSIFILTDPNIASIKVMLRED